MSVCLPIYLVIYLSVYLPIDLSIYLFIYLAIYYISVYLLPVYLSIYLSTFTAYGFVVFTHLFKFAMRFFSFSLSFSLFININPKETQLLTAHWLVTRTLKIHAVSYHPLHVYYIKGVLKLHSSPDFVYPAHVRSLGKISFCINHCMALTFCPTTRISMERSEVSNRSAEENVGHVSL